VLFMVRAEAAIMGAAVLGRRLRRQRPIAGLQPILRRFPVGDIVGNESLLDAMRGATFEIEDAVVLDHDLGRHDIKADFAQARCLAEEKIGRDLALVPPGGL